MPIAELHEFFKTSNEANLETTPENIERKTPTENDNQILNRKITNEEIIEAIMHIKNEKSSGQDFILNEYIKASLETFLPIYNALFNIVLDTGVFPSDWNIGMISPIYKGKGNKQDPKNYRPITLLSCLGKVFTLILNNRLTKYLEENNLIEENQAGFRKNYSTMDHVLTLNILLEYMKTKKKTLYCGFIDLRKAYDLINRAMLFKKLEMFDVNGKFFNVILAMYQNTKSRLRCNNLYTTEFTCNIGIRQGENLSSMLFAMYMNDIESFLQDQNCEYVNVSSHDNLDVFFQLFILLYADDTVLLATSVKNFKKLLKAYGEYCKNWNIEINVDKSKIMIFGRHNKRIKFYINEFEVEVVKEFKYLGIIFTNNQRFTQTIKSNVSKGKRAIYSILSKAKSNGLSLSCQIHLFKVIVLPIFLYGCEVWGYENLAILEKAQLEFCRILLKLNKSTPKYFLLSETGLLPIHILVKNRIVKYWANIMTGKRTKVARKAVECAENHYTHSMFKSRWLKFIYDTLTENGMLHISIYPNSYRHAEFKQRLEDQYYQNYQQELENSNRSLFFKCTAEIYGFKEILDDINPGLAYYFLKYRTSNHKLPVETGRWANIPFHERKCPLCINDLGDEFHYLFVCPQFDEKRKKFIKPYYYRHPNMIKTKDLFTNTDIDVIRKLCLMIKEIILYFKN